MKLEDLAKERWTDSSSPFDVWVMDDYSCERRTVVAKAAPEMLALLLNAYALKTPAEWFDRRDALLARLRKEIETE